MRALFQLPAAHLEIPGPYGPLVAVEVFVAESALEHVRHSLKACIARGNGTRAKGGGEGIA